MKEAERGKKKILNEREAIREYLLGALSSKEEMRRIEEKLLLDDEFAEKLSVAEDELIEEYLDETLTESEHNRFVQFFLTLPQRNQKLRLIQNLRKYAAKSEDQTVRQFTKEKTGWFDWQKLFTSPAFRFAAVVLLLFGIGFGIWRVAFYQSDVDKGLAQLRIAYRGQRSTESRTTAKFDYAPNPNTRGELQVAVNQAALKRAERLFSDAAENSGDGEAHHALGLFYLAGKKFDDALREFNVALKLEPKNAKFNSDVGALYLERANQSETQEKYDENLENLALALKFFNSALETDDSLLEALFNKALVLQKMRLTNQAQEAWQKYLEKDSTSPWADEARRNLELLKRQNDKSKDKPQVLQDFLDAFHNKDDARAWEIASQTKELISGTMISLQLAEKFLEANEQSRKDEADELLSAFVYLGELEKLNAKDLYFSELAIFYKNASQTQYRKLREAHKNLQEGHKLIKNADWTTALEVLENARILFTETGDYWEAKIVEYQIYHSLSRIDRIKESNEKLLALSDFAAPRNYKWLQVLADGWIGATYFLIGETSKAILYDNKALETAQGISDNYNIHRILVQFTEIYRTIGDSRKALNFAFQDLFLPDSYNTFPRQKWRSLNYTMEILNRFKFYDAALAFGEESVDVAQNKAQDDWMLSTSRRNMAKTYGELKKFEEAYRQIDSTLQISQTFKVEAMRKRLVAISLQILADLQRQAGDCGKAVENYNQAIQTYRDMEFDVFKYDALKGRLLCNVIQQNDTAIKEEFPTILQSFDEDRKKIKKEADRNTFFDAEQTVYDSAINYAYSNLKDTEQAFNYAENSRSRSLLNLIRGNSESSQPLSLAEIRERMPSNTQMVYYAVLADKILIWQISATKYFVAEVPVKPEELNDKVQKYLNLLNEKNDGEEIKDAAKELYKLLIQPIESMLEPNKSLCIVADKMLFRIPFASLISRQTNKYLIEDYELLYAPSATVFTDETEIARQKESIQNETLLSIGNPTFSNKEYPELQNLPSAKREAEEIKPFYESASAKVFVEKNAVKEQIISNFNEADVVNFAGHYVPNSNSPSLSKFLLASSDLTVEEIMQNKMPRVRLMILSACETGVEKFYNGEGMIGASRAFLASGVPLVVASQWSVDSDATADLIINFHRYRKLKGLTTIAALRQAQIDMLSGEKSQFRQPYYWAGFLPIGGYANY